MAARVHLHLHVEDLPRSLAFYEAFLGAPPVKRESDYAKFEPSSAPLVLALTSGRPDRTKTPLVDHVGLVLDSTEAVERHLAHAQQQHLYTKVEMGVDCCYANQDKFWVRDPDGIQWEVYHLNHDLAERGTPETLVSNPTSSGSCCTPAPDAQAGDKPT